MKTIAVNGRALWQRSAAEGKSRNCRVETVACEGIRLGFSSPRDGQGGMTIDGVMKMPSLNFNAEKA
jgi:hypothetical protein